MKVTLISKENLISINLPSIFNGKYWFEDTQSNNKLLSVEADEERRCWVIKTTLTITLFDKDYKEVDEIALKENEINYVRFGANTDNMAFLLVEEEQQECNIYEKFALTQDCELVIGRNNDCDIIIDNELISGKHGVLEFKNSLWSLQANQGTNGIYVNGARFSGAGDIAYGSCIYIFGTKIIVANGFFAINNPNDSVRISSKNIKRIVLDTYYDDNDKEIAEEKKYYRSPRFIRTIETFKLKVDMPTQAEKADETPILLTLAPSMIMGVASFATGILTIMNTMNNDGNIVSALPTLIMSISMLAGMIIFPFIMKKRENKNKIKKEEYRRQQYIKYLSYLRAEVESNKRRQMGILLENNPMIIEKVHQNDFWKSGLWSKNKEDEDYLFIRLGLGDLPMKQEIIYPEERFTLEDDDMRDALFKFQKEEKLLKNVPVGLDLKNTKYIGITGNNKSIVNAINVITMQIALLHGYDEVKIAFLGQEHYLSNIKYIKDINHIWDDAKDSRYLATNEDDARELVSELNKLIIKRSENRVSGTEPYMIIIVTDRKLGKALSFVDADDKNNDDKVRVIYCFENGELPRECETIVNLDVATGLIYGKSIENYNGISYLQDILKTDECKKIIQKSLKFKLSLNDTANNLPKKYEFMEMFKVGKAEHLNIMNRWITNNPVQSLKTEVGVEPNGDKFYLDLHEKVHGPHGLVAGMTGSGKSEFIISYILSMAINYHPDEVAFVLIDYKGGGLAGAFDNDNYTLPHLAGTITNLDTSSIYRSILAINSELTRRQKVFGDVKTETGEATMDIYKYQKMYREGKVSEPMPHLFIISDEFAELKAQQPEFMDELISTARIGRSLGVHLILATQKPSGVVNEQIWANSKFKVCLKVQDKSDSMEMLKRPDAAELTNIGRFYLQVGYNELFLLGQSAWSGAIYPDTEEYINEGEKDVEIINELGNTIDKIKCNNTTISKENGEQIVRIMKYLDSLAKEINYSQRQLWLPPLAEKIYLDELIGKYGLPNTDKLIAIAGELDDPYTQSQKMLTVDFEEKGNAIVFGNGSSGIELFVETTLYSMFNMYSPVEFNAYILDFENESLKKFKDIPHVGGIFTDGEDDKISNLSNYLNDEIIRRRKLLSDFGGDINAYNKSNEAKLTKIVVMINNYAHFVESYERLEEGIMAMCRDGIKCGIYFIITANSASSIRYRVAQNFAQNFVLKLNDAGDYNAILGSLNGRIPEKYEGSGMVKDKNIYMFQSARFSYDEDNEKQNEHIRRFCEALQRKYGTRKAHQIKAMPDKVEISDLYDVTVDFDSIPIGIQYKNYNVALAKLNNTNILGVISEKLSETRRFVPGLLYVLGKIDADIVVINGDEETTFDNFANNTTIRNDVADAISDIYALCKERHAIVKQEDNSLSKEFKPIICVLNDCSKIYEDIAGDEKTRFNNCMSSDFVKQWNVYFIIIGEPKILSNNSIQVWSNDRIANNCIWIGDGLKENKNNINLKTEIRNDKIGKDSGFYCINGKAKAVKLVMVVEQGGEDDE